MREVIRGPIRARHILVRHEFEAKDLQRKLREGVSFEELARKYSTCPSAPLGGDLGDLTKKLDRLDESFREALEKLKAGEISGPVRSSFGYHLIQRY